MVPKITASVLLSEARLRLLALCGLYAVLVLLFVFLFVFLLEFLLELLIGLDEGGFCISVTLLLALFG
jgi:hypothetical protein